jgi:uncharacterized protein YggU (UPF0235/DUF167 family)
MRGRSSSRGPIARVEVRVTPGAREDVVLGWQGEVLRVRVRARAEGGQANEAVCRLLAEELHLPVSAVRIAHSATAHRKFVSVDGIDKGALTNRLADQI